MLISISTFVAGIFLFIFIVLVKKGQYEDVETPAIRMLFEDELVVEDKGIDSQRDNEKQK